MRFAGRKDRAASGPRPAFLIAGLLSIPLSISLAVAQNGSGSGAGSGADRPAAAPGGAERRAGSAENAATVDLDDLLKHLGERARAYEAIALKFVCIETLHSSESPNDDRRFDYMYVEAQEQRYLPYRQRHTGKPARGIAETSLTFNFPDSYSWTLMFLQQRQQLFHFRYAGEEWFSLRLAHVLEFSGPLPFTHGQTIYEWSGKVWIDAENYNFLKVEAEPGNQQDRLQSDLKAYRQAPRILIYPMARRPRGSKYNITFLNEFQKLSLPDQAEYRLFSVDLDGEESLEDQTTLRYTGYQFFGVNVKDILLK